MLDVLLRFIVPTVLIVITLHDTWELRERWHHAHSRAQKSLIIARCLFLWIATVGVIINDKVTEDTISDLEKAIKPPAVSDAEYKTFVDSLKNSIKGEIPICISSPSVNTENFAMRVRSMLNDAGYGVTKPSSPDATPGVINLIGLTAQSHYVTNVYLSVPRDSADYPPYTGDIQRAFKSIGINAVAIPQKHNNQPIKLETYHMAIVIIDTR